MALTWMGFTFVSLKCWSRLTNSLTNLVKAPSFRL
jgi:hypothetical protein